MDTLSSSEEFYSSDEYTSDEYTSEEELVEETKQSYENVEETKHSYDLDTVVADILRVKPRSSSQIYLDIRI